MSRIQDNVPKFGTTKGSALDSDAFTARTLEYIQKLVSIVDSKNSIAFINGQPTSLLFQYVASIVYPGDLDELSGFRWMDVVKIWGLPSGPYFTIDSFAKTVDN